MGGGNHISVGGDFTVNYGEFGGSASVGGDFTVEPGGTFTGPVLLFGNTDAEVDFSGTGSFTSIEIDKESSLNTVTLLMRIKG